MHTLRASSLALSFLLFSAPAGAEKKIDGSAPAKSGEPIHIQLVDGELKVRVKKGGKVTVKGTAADDVDNLSVSKGEVGVRIDAHMRKTGDSARSLKGLSSYMTKQLKRKTTGETKLVVTVPPGANLFIRGTALDVDVEGDVKTVRLQTSSGDIRIQGVSRVVDAKTETGGVNVRGAGEASVSTTSGNVVVAGGPFKKLDARTTSGDVTVKGALAGDGPFRLEAVSGDVTWHAPKKQKARLQLSVLSGSKKGSLKGGEKDPEVSLKAVSGDAAVVTAK
jgi:hypothetical protein